MQPRAQQERDFTRNFFVGGVLFVLGVCWVLFRLPGEHPRPFLWYDYVGCLCVLQGILLLLSTVWLFLDMPMENTHAPTPALPPPPCSIVTTGPQRYWLTALGPCRECGAPGVSNFALEASQPHTQSL